MPTATGMYRRGRRQRRVDGTTAAPVRANNLMGAKSVGGMIWPFGRRCDWLTTHQGRRTSPIVAANAGVGDRGADSPSWWRCVSAGGCCVRAETLIG
ncbi:hypothetical protein MRB53_038062 [Persea americana]|nr:hypothetical protein MRB53_038062 [Persea americana]